MNQVFETTIENVEVTDIPESMPWDDVETSTIFVSFRIDVECKKWGVASLSIHKIIIDQGSVTLVKETETGTQRQEIDIAGWKADCDAAVDEGALTLNSAEINVKEKSVLFS